jgi:putative membrane protein
VAGVLERVARQAVTGAIAGCRATGAMSVEMLAVQRLLPRHERYPLAPRQIVSRLTCWIAIRQDLDRTQVDALTVLAHVGYSTSAGALYGSLAAWMPARVPPPIRGVVYGLLVWSGSSLGLLPALDILRPATQHPAAPNALLRGAHVVWGASLGFLAARIGVAHSRRAAARSTPSPVRS